MPYPKQPTPLDRPTRARFQPNMSRFRSGSGGETCRQRHSMQRVRPGGKETRVGGTITCVYGASSFCTVSPTSRPTTKTLCFRIQKRVLVKETKFHNFTQLGIPPSEPPLQPTCANIHCCRLWITCTIHGWYVSRTTAAVVACCACIAEYNAHALFDRNTVPYMQDGTVSPYSVKSVFLGRKCRTVSRKCGGAHAPSYISTPTCVSLNSLRGCLLPSLSAFNNMYVPVQDITIFHSKDGEQRREQHG